MRAKSKEVITGEKNKNPKKTRKRWEKKRREEKTLLLHFHESEMELKVAVETCTTNLLHRKESNEMKMLLVSVLSLDRSGIARNKNDPWFVLLVPVKDSEFQERSAAEEGDLGGLRFRWSKESANKQDVW